jgi:hypothetical protein
MSMTKVEQVASKFTTLPQWSKAINLSWKLTTEGMLRTAEFCCLAQKKYPGEQQLKDLKDQLLFSAGTFSKLVQIGGDKRLYKEPLKSLLPPSYGTAYGIKQQETEVLDAAVSEGIIHPDMPLIDFNKWLCKRSGKTAEEDSDFVKTTLLVPAGDDYRKLAKILEQQGCKWTPPKKGIERDPAVERASAALAKRAKQTVNDSKSEALRKAGTNPDARKRAWPHDDKDVAITKNMTWEAISSVFAKIGLAEVFGHILDEVLALHPLDAATVRVLDPRRQEEVIRESIAEAHKRNNRKVTPEKLARLKFK